MAIVMAKKSRHMGRIIREAIEIELNANNMNRHQLWSPWL
jgi:hypothetical protein